MIRIPPLHVCAKTVRGQCKSAFTLIELLVVIAIIALLVSLLFPAASVVREISQTINCKNNLRELGMGMLSFAVEYEVLPGTSYNGANYNVDYGKPFVGAEAFPEDFGPKLWLQNRDDQGSLSEFLGLKGNAAHRMYRCPSAEFIGFDVGEGSNGITDYSMTKAFSGVPPFRIPPYSLVLINGEQLRMATPLLIEEDPEFFQNNYWIDIGYSNADRMAHRHSGNKGYYFSVGGELHTLVTKNQGPACYDWQTSSGGKFWDSNISWGQWNESRQR